MKLIKGILIISIITILLSGCSETDKVGTKLRDDMNYKDFFSSIHENNDKVVIVYGTIGSEKANLSSEKSAYIYESFMLKFLKVNSSDNIIIKSDSEVTEEDIKNSHIILTGNPSVNSMYKEINEKLPIYIDGDELIAGDKVLTGDKVMFNFVHPNPLNTNKYVWINGSLNNEYIAINQDGDVREDYDIKINENERYKGDFIKEDDEWKVQLGDNDYSDKNNIVKESDNFKFIYSEFNTDVNENIEKIMKEREEIYDNISDKLGFKNPEKINDYILSDFKRTYNKVVYGNKISPYLGNIYEVYGERSSIMLQIYKSIISQKGIALNEFIEYGLFYYITMDKVESGLDIELDIEKVIEDDKYIQFSYMTDYMIDRQLDWGIVATELTLFSKYLVDTYGLDRYIELYETNTEKGLNDSFVKVYGKDLIQLEDEWLSQVEGN